MQHGEVHYDSAGLRLSSLHYQRDPDTGVWFADERSEYIYDTTGNLILWVYWSGWTGEWVYDRKGEQEYDSSGNKILESNYNWDTELDDWIGGSKKSHKYDATRWRPSTSGIRT